jgi:signal transduction histidine kinase/CheY-like chemotaxis protein
MSKKTIRSRLESLFDDLDKDAVYPDRSTGGADSEHRLPGWTWECDHQGRFTTCSPEVHSLLGFSAGEFLNQPLVGFHLTPASTARLAQALECGELPVEVQLEYKTASGELLPVSMQIFAVRDEQGLRWRGVTLAAADAAPAPHIAPEPPADRAPAPSRTRRGRLPTQPSGTGSGAIPAPSIFTGLRQEPPTAPGLRRAAAHPRMRRSGVGTGFQVESSSEGEKMLPAAGFLTSLASHSLNTHSPGVRNAEGENPAMLAVVAPMEDASTDLLLEFLDSSSDRVWSDDERQLVEQVADQLTLALENARLFQETQERAEELGLLRDISLELAQEQRDLDSVLDIITRREMELLASDGGGVWLWRPDEQQLELVITYQVTGANLAGRRLKPGEGLVGKVFLSNQIEVVDDYLSWAGHSEKFEDAPFFSAIGIPMGWQNQVVGVLVATRSQPNYPYSANEQRLAQLLGGQAAAVIQNARLYLEEQRRRQIADTLREVATEISSSLDVREISERMLDRLGVLLEYHTASVHLLQDGIRLHLAGRGFDASAGMESEAIENPMLRPQDQDALIAEVVKTRRPLLLPDTHQDLRWEVHPQTAHIRSWLAAPMVAGGEVLALLLIDHDRPGAYSAETVALVSAVTAQTALAIHNARLFEQTQHVLSETETLYQASAELNAVESFDDILETLRTYTVLGRDSFHASINVFDRTWEAGETPDFYSPIAQWNRRSIPPRSLPDRIQLSEMPGLLALMRREGVTFVPNLSQDRRLDRTARAWLADALRAQALVMGPVVVSGEWIGILTALYEQPLTVTEEEVRRLTTLAGQASVAVQNLRLLEESRRRANQLETAAEIARDTSSTLALDTLLNRTVNLLRERFGYYHAAVFLVEDESQTAVVRAATGEAGAEMKRRGHTLSIGSRSVIGYVTGYGQPLVVNDVTQDPIFRPNALLPLTQAELALPMKIGERVIGALDVQAVQTNAFAPEDISVLQILADQVTVAIDNARSYEISQKAVEEMRELDQLKSQFLANMSHELRTPLNSIIGFSRVILKGIDGPITDLQNQDLTAIYNSGTHLLGLINDVLDLSKIEAGKMELSFEDGVNLADMINGVMSTTAGLVKDKPVRLVKELQADLPGVTCDAMKIRQVLLNLLSNAAKFTDEGTITVQAGTGRNERGRPVVTISVNDTGSGIALEDQEKLFKPFSQVDGSLTRKTGGTGLGLSICQHLINMHGGQIQLESEVGHGTRFYFSLPLPVPVQESQGGGRMILAVDDERQIIQLYERYLESHGYQIAAVTDPNEAVEVARQLQPAAITLDVMMPGKDGWQVLQELKADPATSHIPVIICSIMGEQDKGLRLGATDYLMKPILEEDLIEALNKLNNGEIQEVLVVDDDIEDLRLIEKSFQDHPQYHLRLVEGGANGLAALQQKRPDALILDLLMPVVDGFTILETLRADPDLRDLPVIVYTAADLDEAQREKLAALTQSTLHKGFVSSEELLTNIERALSRVQTNPSDPAAPSGDQAVFTS